LDQAEISAEEAVCARFAASVSIYKEVEVLTIERVKLDLKSKTDGTEALGIIRAACNKFESQLSFSGGVSGRLYSFAFRVISIHLDFIMF
jgi:hypothetical protein